MLSQHNVNQKSKSTDLYIFIVIALFSFLLSALFLCLSAYISLIFVFIFLVYISLFFISLKLIFTTLKNNNHKGTEISEGIALYEVPKPIIPQEKSPVIENPVVEPVITNAEQPNSSPTDTAEETTSSPADTVEENDVITEEEFMKRTHFLTINTPFSVERHTEPFKGFDDVILTDAQYNDDIRQLKKEGQKIAFFDKHGVLIDIFPRNKNISLYEDRQTAYSADYFVMNGKIYDLTKIEDVKNIEIPDFILNGDVNSGIDCLMYMHRGNKDNPELEIAIVNKAFELMTNSKWQHNRQKYIALTVCLMNIDRFDLADTLYEQALPYFDDSEEIKYVNQDYNALKDIYIKKSLRKKEYALVKENLPDLAPESFSGYSRMKNSHSANYQKILSLMKEKGFDIEQNEEENKT